MLASLTHNVIPSISVSTPAQAALANADLVIHAAGPFQRSTNHAVLEQAIRSRVPYLDVCDDLEYSERWAKGQEHENEDSEEA